ncbi:type II toxin-antitoxin system death-on-curing family toxin [Streptacidiphilus anmyonensis]|uniref:type II toxin-antitoxin system death-on-curing family toxin n=1 Tax=Streptacidiphilus anmyonensis TaxID=405782 RepID=UPI000AF14C2A|nr:Fic family protein [Streptacidiphilus anmyonensis]
MTEPGDEVEYIELDDIKELLGGSSMIRDPGLLQSALGRPRYTTFGVDAYPDLWTKAAALGESIARNHALIDRNKRTAFEAMLLFLELNEVAYVAPHPDDAVAYMLRLAQGGYADDIDSAAKDLRHMLGR